ncbi:MAG: hypothetical protein IIY78_01780 [Clostridia bacterium]|nr:hypothetical protein [Clostridia bacterium]
MIKAISRQILEVSDTGSAYFDHAWLMVSPQFSTAKPEYISAQAENYLGSLDAPSGIKRSGTKRRLILSLYCLLSAAIGAAASYAVFLH